MLIMEIRRHPLGGALIASVMSLTAACAPSPTRITGRTTAARSAPTAQSPRPPTHFDIPQDRYFAHIVFLAHDELQGRGTGSDGIDLAAGYIAGQFAAAGLQPGGPGGTYFQEFKLPGRQTLVDGNELVIEAVTPGAAALPTATLGEDFTPFSFSAQGDFQGDALFAGYGIINPDQNHDDYMGIDAAGAVLLMLRREPPGWRTEGGFTDHARFDRKVALAAEKGAAAVLIVNQDPGDDGTDSLMTFGGRQEAGSIAAIQVTRKLADALLIAGRLPSLTELQKQLDAKEGNRSAALPGVHVHGTVAYSSTEMIARNVIGLLPGNGPHASEHVVVGAHYDHLGVSGGDIFNGADDNASGTAAVIEAAKALAHRPDRDRSLLFVAFTAEEIGLLGSEHYVRNSTVPIESVVAMINMDMIGRLNHDDEANMLAIQGLGTGDAFPGVIGMNTAAAGIKFLPDESANGPSDHASFYEAGVPSLFFFTGVHEDYHQPGDESSKINVAGGTQVAELVCEIAYDLSNGGERPRYAKVDQPARIFRGTSAGDDDRVFMGFVPSRATPADEEGWRVDSVAPERSAAKAGMRPGDRILAIDGHRIRGQADYRSAIKDKKPGDVVAVTVKRGEEELSLSIELYGAAAP